MPAHILDILSVDVQPKGNHVKRITQVSAKQRLHEKTWFTVESSS